MKTSQPFILFIEPCFEPGVPFFWATFDIFAKQFKIYILIIYRIQEFVDPNAFTQS